jgi:transcriptional regulator with PAS, ATPase and Fis domain
MSRDRSLVERYPLDPTVVASSPAMEQPMSIASRLATSNVMVPLTGERGGGKAVFAQLIPNRSARSSGRFVARNCAGVAETLLESELLGHVATITTIGFRAAT